MSQSTSWTNEKILHELFWFLLEDIYRIDSEKLLQFRETVLHSTDEELKEWIASHRLLSMMTLLDRSRGPLDWPGITLVNRETGEGLSEDFEMAYSRVEGEYMDYLDGDIEADESDEPDI
jgi:hypothetical protein